MKHNYIIAAIIYVFLVGCSASESDPFYESCLSIGMQEQMQGMDESDRKSVRFGVEKACDMLSEECKENPEGVVCFASKEKFNSK